MKRKYVLLILLIYVGIGGYAQTSDEWLAQKKTQKKYLLEQIGALQIYIDYAEKGYKIVADGLHTIQNIKKGDFDIHRLYISSRKAVNPVIKRYSKVVGIVDLQLRIINKTGQVIRNMSNSKQFTDGELEYCTRVFNNLLTDCLNDMEELNIVLTANELELKDDERIKRIDMLYREMQSKYAFGSDFADEIGVLAVQRIGEAIDIQTSEIVNGLK